MPIQLSKNKVVKIAENRGHNFLKLSNCDGGQGASSLATLESKIQQKINVFPLFRIDFGLL